MSGRDQDLSLGLSDLCQDESCILNSHDPPTFNWALGGGVSGRWLNKHTEYFSGRALPGRGGTDCNCLTTPPGEGTARALGRSENSVSNFLFATFQGGVIATPTDNVSVTRQTVLPHHKA